MNNKENLMEKIIFIALGGGIGQLAAQLVFKTGMNERL